MVTGENLALSDDEYESLKQINAELADSALASVEGVTVAYDAQGQAIVRLSGQMDNMSEAWMLSAKFEHFARIRCAISSKNGDNAVHNCG